MDEETLDNVADRIADQMIEEMSLTELLGVIGGSPMIFLAAGVGAPQDRQNMEVQNVDSLLATLRERSDPSSPPSGWRAIYRKSDGIYDIDSNGNVNKL